jgi:hypothetical protein
MPASRIAAGLEITNTAPPFADTAAAPSITACVPFVCFAGLRFIADSVGPRWTPKTGQLWTPENRPVR